jgi:6-hydroxycyclohex-1-ene-1-carbonyl-CoA dehydrogenase
VVPATGLCPVPDLSSKEINQQGLTLELLAVIADAVSTPFQAIRRSQLGAGDLAIFVGIGGVGGFGVQIAAALGAHVVGIDVDPARLEALEEYGTTLSLDAGALDFKQLRKAVAGLAEEKGVPTYRWRIFECSGTPAGQSTAFGLLRHGGYLGVLGYTPGKVEIRLSNLMALDAVAEGNWGCLPEHYPAIVDLVLAGEIVLAPFVEKRPLSAINETFEELHAGKLTRRPILIPER